MQAAGSAGGYDLYTPPGSAGGSGKIKAINNHPVAHFGGCKQACQSPNIKGGRWMDSSSWLLIIPAEFTHPLDGVSVCCLHGLLLPIPDICADIPDAYFLSVDPNGTLKLIKK
jgi:hypothetical protein